MNTKTSKDKKMLKPSSIRIMLVDDQVVVRSALNAFLLAYDDLELVAEAADGEEAIRLCKRFRPDVILMDIVMPRMDGVTATRLIRSDNPHVQVLFLTSFFETQLLEDARKVGAVGYLLKDVAAEDLANAVRTAYQAGSLAQSAAHPWLQFASATLGMSLSNANQEFSPKTT